MQNKTAIKRPLRNLSKYSYGLSLPKRFLKELGWSESEDIYLTKNANSILLSTAQTELNNDFAFYGQIKLKHGKFYFKDNHQRDVSINVPFALFSTNTTVYLLDKEQFSTINMVKNDVFTLKNHNKLSFVFNQIASTIDNQRYNKEIKLIGHVQGVFEHDNGGLGRIYLTADTIKVGNSDFGFLKEQALRRLTETSNPNKKVESFLTDCKIKGKQVTINGKRGLVSSPLYKDKTVSIRYEDETKQRVPLSKVLNALLQTDIEVRRWFNSAF